MTEGIERELSFWLASELKPVNQKTLPLEPRLHKCGVFATRFREEARRKDMQELDELEREVLRNIRYHQSESSLKVEDVYGLMDAKKDEKIDEEEFLKFLSTCKVAQKEAKEGEAKEG